MFVCKLCENVLSAKENITGTYCGHIFHEECLDHHLSNKSCLCPTCDKSLKVDLTSITSGYSYATLPLYPEEGKNKEKPDNETKANAEYLHQQQEQEERLRLEHLKTNSVIQENELLRRRLVEVCQALVTLQKDGTSRSRVDLPSLLSNGPTMDDKNYHNEEPNHYPNEYPSSPGMNMLNQSVNYVLVNGENPIESDSLDFTSPDLLVLWDKPRLTSLSEQDKSRILRSKRREYLTLRNKAQTWLSKMELGIERLLKEKETFTSQHYLEELRLFYNKIYSQGKILDVVREAAVVYLIIEEISDKERSDIKSKIHELTKSYTSMMSNVMNQLSDLENQTLLPNSTSTGRPETPSFLEQYFESISSSSTHHSDRCSSLSEDDAIISTSFHTTSNNGLVINLLSKNSDDENFHDPVFV